MSGSHAEGGPSIRGRFGVLVVAHPTLIEVNVFTARRAAIAQNLIGIQAEGPLEIVRGDVRGGRSLRGLGAVLAVPSGPSRLRPTELTGEKVATARGRR